MDDGCGPQYFRRHSRSPFGRGTGGLRPLHFAMGADAVRRQPVVHEQRLRTRAQFARRAIRVPPNAAQGDLCVGVADQQLVSSTSARSPWYQSSMADLLVSGTALQSTLLVVRGRLRHNGFISCRPMPICADVAKSQSKFIGCFCIGVRGVAEGVSCHLCAISDLRRSESQLAVSNDFCHRNNGRIGAQPSSMGRVHFPFDHLQRWPRINNALHLLFLERGRLASESMGG